MESGYSIRRARLSLPEAEALLAVEQQSLGDSPYTPQKILAVMQRPEHYAYVAALGDELVGFCSCLETPAADERRLEIDMLGVVPVHRRRGLASRLITRAVAEANTRGIHVFRGAVAVGDTASQRAFQHAGLNRSSYPFDLLVREVHPDDPPASLPASWAWQVKEDNLARIHDDQVTGGYAPDWPQQTCWLEQEGTAVARAEYLQVCTMAYRGLWLGKLWAVSDEAMGLIARVLAERARELALDKVGHLAPRTPPGNGRSKYAALLESQGYRAVGSYYLFAAERP